MPKKYACEGAACTPNGDYVTWCGQRLDQLKEVSDAETEPLPNCRWCSGGHLGWTIVRGTTKDLRRRTVGYTYPKHVGPSNPLHAQVRAAIQRHPDPDLNHPRCLDIGGLDWKLFIAKHLNNFGDACRVLDAHLGALVVLPALVEGGDYFVGRGLYQHMSGKNVVDHTWMVRQNLTLAKVLRIDEVPEHEANWQTKYAQVHFSS